MASGYFSCWNDELDRNAGTLGTGPVALYIYLVRRANTDGIAWPSIETMAGYYQISENTVRNYLKQLEEHGMISREPREGHAGGYQYRITAHVTSGREPERVQRLNPLPPKRVQRLKGSNSEGVQPLSQKGFNGCAEKGSNSEPEEYTCEEDSWKKSTSTTTTAPVPEDSEIQRDPILEILIAANWWIFHGTEPNETARREYWQHLAGLAERGVVVTVEQMEQALRQAKAWRDQQGRRGPIQKTGPVIFELDKVLNPQAAAQEQANGASRNGNGGSSRPGDPGWSRNRTGPLDREARAIQEEIDRDERIIAAAEDLDWFDEPGYLDAIARRNARAAAAGSHPA